MYQKSLGVIAAGCLFAFGSTFTLPAQAESITHEMGIAEFDSPPTRIAVSNWALTESLLALGVDPIAIPEAEGYREWVVEPKLPENFTDLGTRREPNFEALRDAKPDAIVITGDAAMAYDKLNGFAPTLVYSIYDTDSGEPAMDRAEEMLRNLGTLTGKSEQAETVIASVNDRIAAAAERIRAVTGEDAKFAIIRVLDEAHFRIHGETSLFGSVLARMGFENAWTGEVNGWGFGNGDISDLSTLGDAHVAYVEPVETAVKAKLFNSVIWKSLPFARNDHLYAIPPAWTFGGVLSGARFAEFLADTVTNTSGS
ncbi:iron-siderophore ABC transporter substrate-binding protein [Thalassospira sp. MA62]|nr:iron-siderophore ABC transporter substrate-binding protein [Thalassospira sp. MA62]